MNKRALYESIMKNVAREVKKALNEGTMYNGIDDMEKTKVVLNFAEGPDSFDDYIEYNDDPDPDLVKIYDQLLNDGIDLANDRFFDMTFFDYPNGLSTNATDENNNPVPSNKIPMEIRNLMVKIVKAYEANYLDTFETIIPKMVNVIDTIDYTDGTSFMDTWYVVNLRNGQKCIIIEGMRRDTFAICVVQ